ncbi:hypothetical protein [Methanobacterium sp. BAmetb5]|uniref:hypothetical protein n=1 Tax=Methanobacterium sp. BAmetb5 TaxID=2025351 RepID=UPI000E8D70D1|nr:hypothetical protein [Methanobacterium sp. BAmetb5]AXV39092.1 MAG: hypothetical protein CIT02_01565 [Methanobacterium sp. BAmetb5]
MTSISKIQSSMKALTDKKTEKSIITRKINDLKLQKDILIKELPTLEEELSIWQNDISKLEKNNQSVDELNVWNDEIKSIEFQIEKIKSDIKENSLDFKKENNIESNLKDEIDNLILELKTQIFEILKSENLSTEYNKNEIITLTEILKTVLESNSNLNIEDFIEIISNEGVNISLNYLEIINQVFGEKLVILPEVISKFISDYLNDLKPGNVLDPWPLNGFMSKSLLELKNKDIITLKTNSTILKNLINTEFQSNSEIKKSYDFIVGCPPIDNLISINDDLKDIISDDIASINFIHMAQKISAEGEGLFILEPDFLLKRETTSTFSNLNEFGLYIKAIIEIPYILAPDETDKILLIVSKKYHNDIFVGTLSHDYDANKILKNNLILRKLGKIPQYGYITTLSSFFTFKSFYAQIESLKISESSNFNTKSFSSVVKEVQIPSKNCETEVQVNSLFLPLDENFKVVVDNDKIVNTDYLHLILNQKCCLAEYLANYINDTLLGQKIRESITIGKYTPALFDDLISNTEIYLPDLDSQVEVLRVDSIISEITARANSYRDQLWKNPDEYKLITEHVDALDDKREYHFEKWLESLPYPLSSILWESFRTSKADLKVRYLLHFFEAFSEFNVIIMLSGLISDDRFFNREFYRCTQFNPKFKNWYYHPSFGNWNFFGSCLAKNLRFILGKQYKRNQLLNIFGAYNPVFIEKISSYELYEILNEVSRYRNSWDAHGPVVSKTEYGNRYKILRNSISKLYNCINDIFKDNLLVLPLDNTFNDSIYYYTAKKFMGSNNRFISMEIESMSPMDSNNIYLIMDNNRKPIKLLPLLKYYKDTCYFYNSLVKDEYKTQFVSYHNKEKPQIFCPSIELDDFYSIFERDTYY